MPLIKQKYISISYAWLYVLNYWHSLKEPQERLIYDTYTRVVLDIVHLNSKDQFATLHIGRHCGSGITGVILARRLANSYRNNLSV